MRYQAGIAFLIGDFFAALTNARRQWAMQHRAEGLLLQ